MGDVIKSRILIKPNAEYRHIINWRNMIDIIISRATLKNNEEMLDISKISKMFKCQSSSKRDQFLNIIIKRKMNNSMISRINICKSMISS